jgi:V-type H+-transporting ATPase subunit H
MAYAYLNDPDGSSEVLSAHIPWETYSTARLITEKDLQLIKRYDKRSEELRASMLDEVSGLT